jgi:hypothetical protein
MSDFKELIINSKFRDLFPPLTDESNVPNNPDEGLIIHAEGYLHSDGDGMKAVKVWVDDPPVIEVME